jgi:hypothetical protein
MAKRSFFRPDINEEDCWRSIVLFGRNVASYKFALAASLLDLTPASGDLIRLEELAVPFARHIRQHLSHSDKQGTSSSSKFLDACRGANSGDMNESELIETTARLGFVNVIDAFHVVGGDDVPLRFFVDERNSHGGIRVTDSFSRLMETVQFSNLTPENEARWRLVETAWELNLPAGLLSVNYDKEKESLFVVDGANRRKAVTEARDALNGYQKGRCFYCCCPVSLSSAEVPEVDHLFAHKLKELGLNINLDGIWNLVLACSTCNGAGEKWDKMPALRFLEKLSQRNEFLISSHHPLRETLMSQAGPTENDRHDFLQSVYGFALPALVHEWEPREECSPCPW